jgi:ribosome-associated protein
VRLRFDIKVSSLPYEVRSKLRSRIGDYAEVTVSDSRSQFRNRVIARQRLKEKLEKALLDPPRRRETKPTKASKERRLDAKKARSDTKRLRKAPQDGE